MFSSLNPQEEQMVMEFEIDSRIHNRIIGPRGKNVRKLMDQFKVDIRFPKGEQNKCVVTGLEENCESAKEHLQMLEEEYVSQISNRLPLPLKILLKTFLNQD